MSNGSLRRAATVTVLVGLALSAGACGGGGGGGSDTVTVGFELPLSGNFSANGHNEQNGFELGLQDFGRTVNGHKIHVKYVDTHADPATALTDARSLVQTNHIDVFEGPLAANEIGAVTPFMGQQGIPVDDLSFCSSQQYTDYNKFANGMSSGWGCDQPALAGGEWAAKVKHWKHVVTVGQDFSFGWEVVGGFAAAFKDGGGVVDKYIWVPNNATDLSAYVSQIPKDVDAVYAEMSGALAVKFTKLYQSYGLKSKVPLLGITQVTDYSVLPSESEQAITGIYTDAQYCDGISSKANQKFVTEYKAKYHTYPGYYSDAGYVKAQILVSALKAVHGDASDHKALAKAMRAVQIQAPRGPVEISTATWSPIQSNYICQVKKVDGELRNVPIKTYPRMQPWGPLTKQAWLAHYKHDSSGRPG